jgi:cytoskeletal protein RodZ
MATPASPAPQPGETTPTKKPTALIVAVVILGLAVIGLAIWGFSTKSDLDSANKKVKAQASTIQKQDVVIAATDAREKTDVAIEDQEVAKFARTKHKLKHVAKTAAQQKSEIATQKAQVVTAQQQLADANTQNQKLAAEANLAKQQLDVAHACMSGTISAIDSVFAAPSAKAGVARLNRDLADLSADCKESVG